MQLQELQRKKQEDEDCKRKEAAVFKARGILVAQQPFMPHPSSQPLTVALQPSFALDQRAEARSLFDLAQAEREREAEVGICAPIASPDPLSPASPF